MGKTCKYYINNHTDKTVDRAKTHLELVLLRGCFAVTIPMMAAIVLIAALDAVMSRKGMMGLAQQ